MTLRELLNSADCVRAAEYACKGDFKNLSGYLSVIEYLRNLPVIPQYEYPIEVSIINEDGESYCDVHLIAEKEVLGVDLVPWGELIDVEIINEANLDKESLLGEILWEITFYGFTEEKVRAEKERILKLTDEIKD